MSEHTAEPWYMRTNRHTDTDGRAWGWVDALPPGGSQRPIAGVQITWTRGELSEANARRIVACVNACKGIKTDALARIAELEAELSRKDECIVDGLMQRKDLQSRLAEATKFIQDIADGGGFTGAAAKDFLESTHD